MARNVGVDVDIEVEDVESMLSALNTFFNPLAMMGFLQASVAPVIRQRARERFLTEGDDVSGAWAPLEPVTQQIRGSSNLPISPDHPINRRTDDLYTYITQSNAEVIPLGSFGAQMTYPGSPPTGPWTAKKVETAQVGRNKPRTVPRPVLGLSMVDLTYVIGALGIGIKKAGGFP
jgi:hypothetical protein